MSIYKTHPSDHVARWFEERKKLGIDDTIYWARYKPETDDLKVSQYSHAKADGMSIMLHLLREAGIKDATVPLCRETRAPSSYELKAIRKQQKPVPKKIQWKHWQPVNPTCTQTIDTVLFSEEETQFILNRASSMHIPLNTLILWSVNRAAAKHLIKSRTEYSWFYPVNLRGAVNYGTDYANYSSGFYLPVTGDIALEDMHQQIRRKLKTGEHWATWQQAKIAKYLPGFLIRLIYRLMSNKQYYAGNFSAMGTWTEELLGEKCRDKDYPDLLKERWFCCAPGTKNYPISSCVMNWNGQLSLTLKLHPAIIKTHEDSLQTLYDWGNNLFGEALLDLKDPDSKERLITIDCDDSSNGRP